MRLIAVYNHTLFMFIEKGIDEYDDFTECVVYDARRKKKTEGGCIGSWSKQIWPWKYPTETEKEKANSIIKGMLNV